MDSKHRIILAFNEGILWMYTFDEDTANEWLADGKIECWAWYEAQETHS